MLVLHLEPQGDNPAPWLLGRSFLHRRHHGVNSVPYAHRIPEIPVQTEKPERRSVNKILMSHKPDSHRHTHRAMRDALAVAGGLAEFLVYVQRVPVARNPSESDDISLAHGTPARRQRPVQRELLEVESHARALRREKVRHTPLRP